MCSPNEDMLMTMATACCWPCQQSADEHGNSVLMSMATAAPSEYPAYINQAVAQSGRGEPFRRVITMCHITCVTRPYWRGTGALRGLALAVHSPARVVAWPPGWRWLLSQQDRRPAPPVARIPRHGSPPTHTACDVRSVSPGCSVVCTAPASAAAVAPPVQPTHVLDTMETIKCVTRNGVTC